MAGCADGWSRVAGSGDVPVGLARRGDAAVTHTGAPLGPRRLNRPHGHVRCPATGACLHEAVLHDAVLHEPAQHGEARSASAPTRTVDHREAASTHAGRRRVRCRGSSGLAQQASAYSIVPPGQVGAVAPARRVTRSIPGTEGLTPAPLRHATPSLAAFPTVSVLSRTGGGGLLPEPMSGAGGARRLATVGNVRDAIAALVEKCNRSRERLGRLSKIVDSISRCPLPPPGNFPHVLYAGGFSAFTVGPRAATCMLRADLLTGNQPALPRSCGAPVGLLEKAAPFRHPALEWLAPLLPHDVSCNFFCEPVTPRIAHSY